MADFAAALMASDFGAWARGKAYVWANLVHLLGMVMLVGGIGLLDLRIAGLILQVPSGFTLFAADAVPLMKSETFRWKIALIAVALANAVAFRVLWRKHIDGIDTVIPLPARFMAAMSVALWLWIAALGRLIAYA